MRSGYTFLVFSHPYIVHYWFSFVRLSFSSSRSPRGDDSPKTERKVKIASSISLASWDPSGLVPLCFIPSDIRDRYWGVSSFWAAKHAPERRWAGTKKDLSSHTLATKLFYSAATHASKSPRVGTEWNYRTLQMGRHMFPVLGFSVTIAKKGREGKKKLWTCKWKRISPRSRWFHFVTRCMCVCMAPCAAY